MVGHVRAVRDVAPRVLGLVRVSAEKGRGDELLSPAIQRTAISDHAAGRGYALAGWMEGIDESGSSARSAWWARLDQAVVAVEAGEYDGIVVWKFSRIARNRLRWAVALDRVESAGGFLESATEDFDTSTSAGRLARGMLGELNAFEAARIGEGWKEAHAARVGSGRPKDGKPRFGYVYDLERKVHVPDPVTGPVLANLYRRYVAGESVYQLVRWLNGHGWRTTAGRPWSDRSLRRVLDSGFASGRFMAGGDPRRKVAPTLHEGVHEPLIDDQLWQAYLDARAGRRALPARSVRSEYLLSGLVVCARCGGRMVAGQYGSRREPKYRCKRGKEQGPGVCTGGYVMAATVEGEVVEWLREVAAADVDEAAERVDLAGVRRATAASEAERLAREVARVEEALARLAVQNAERPLPEAVYGRAYDELAGQLVPLRAALEDAGREARTAVVDPGAAARGVLAEWEVTPVGVRRTVLRSLVAAVVVLTGRPRARVRVVPVWDCW